VPDDAAQVFPGAARAAPAGIGMTNGGRAVRSAPGDGRGAAGSSFPRAVPLRAVRGGRPRLDT